MIRDKSWKTPRWAWGKQVYGMWYFPFSALTLLVGRQEGHAALKETGCWFVGGRERESLWTAWLWSVMFVNCSGGGWSECKWCCWWDKAKYVVQFSLCLLLGDIFLFIVATCIYCKWESGGCATVYCVVCTEKRAARISASLPEQRESEVSDGSKQPCTADSV